VRKTRSPSETAGIHLGVRRLNLYLTVIGTFESPADGGPRSSLAEVDVVSREKQCWAALPLSLVLLAGLLAMPASASVHGHGAHLPDQVIVRYHDGTPPSKQSKVEAQSGTEVLGALPGGSKRLGIEDGDSVAETVAELRRDSRVAYAVPNYIARAGAFTPNDQGFSLQWNFWGPFGINMPEAWSFAAQWGAPGGRGAVVAVLDTGVAYRRLGSFRRAPDLRAFVRGYDFVDDDPFPLDVNGHGTHVAGTIAAATNNRIGTAGIAYGSRIMPVRTLDERGAGDAATITKAILYAVRHHADVINLSLEFPPFVRASDIPDLLAALRYARRHRVVVTAVAGNGAKTSVPYPGRSGNVIAVGATTEDGCQAKYSNAGMDVDVAAPGGGTDAVAAAGDPWDSAHCHPEIPGRSIYQQTFSTAFTRFGLPSGYYGTSMAAPHAAGLAAVVVASGRLGPRPKPGAVERLIERTARDLGPPGFDPRYGHGLIDAAAALR
jgi:serine protease